MGRITLLLVDDHAIVREGLKALFGQYPEYQIVAEAGDGREALEILKKRRADIVVLDHSMPGLNGIDAIEEMKRLQPQSRIVVLTGRKEEILVRAAINNGADAYLVKDSNFVELDLAITVALSGRKYISPSVIDPLIQGYLANSSSGGGESRRCSSSVRRPLRSTVQTLCTSPICIPFRR